jgi:SAM-dependent methyltransferase
VAEPWNHNVHYYGFVMSQLPPGCDRALAVGCGEGTLVRRLASLVPSVTGIDSLPEIVERAREQSAGLPTVEFVAGDVMSYPFDGQFDFVASVASLHHLDFETGLERMASLLGPGGVLVIVGLAMERSPLDYALAGLGKTASQVYRRRRGGWWESGALLIDPTMSYAAIRRRSRRLLPGRRYRRHLLYRYSIVWRRPI